MDLGWTFQLHSSPTSSKVIYLDFNGHTTTGTSWNNTAGGMGSSFYSPAYDLNGNPANFSADELSTIQRIWQRVAADFAPFNVDVTTQEPPADWLKRTSVTDPNFGMRVVITSYGPNSNMGGIAVSGSFNASTDTPCYVYNKSLSGVAEAVSHEVGHTLGLTHDGTSGSTYYYGHGGDETSWAPIMGVGYNKNVTTWDNGTYYGSNNSGSSANSSLGADDMAVIALARNGFGFQADRLGDTFATASPLTISGGSVGQFGRIETRLDKDCYSFQLQNSGNVNLTFDPYWYQAYVDRDGIWGGTNLVYTAPVSDGNTSTPYADSGTNLDLAASLYNSAGTLLATANSPGLATSLSWSNLAAGTYYVMLDGVGSGNPTSSTPSGYSDYGSVGNYFISGTITNALNSSGPVGSAGVALLVPATTTTTTPTTTAAKAPAAVPLENSPSQSVRADLGLATPPEAAADAITGLQAATSQPVGLQGDLLLAPLPAALSPARLLLGGAATATNGPLDGMVVLSALASPLSSGSDKSPAALLIGSPWGGAALDGPTSLAMAQRPAWVNA